MNEEEKQKLIGIKETVTDELERTRRKIQGMMLKNGEQDLEKMAEELSYAEERIEQIKQNIDNIQDNGSEPEN